MRPVPTLCILMPAYNEEAGLSATISSVNEKIRRLVEQGLVNQGSFMMFADDGSTDGTWEIIQEAHAADSAMVAGIRLAANRGKENVLFAGIMAAKEHADVVVCMDADLQFDIEAIDDFLRLHREGYDFVYGIKKTRGSEPIYKKLASRAFYAFMGFLGSPIEKNHTDYCLMTKRVCEALAEYGETNLILRGLLKSLGFRQAPCYFNVIDRASGESHFSAGKLLNLSLDAITSFSVAPLRVIVLVGVLMLLVSVAMIVWCIVDYVHGITPSGYATIVCSFWFLGGVMVMCLGVVGEYLGKLYMEAKKRPRYHMAEVLIK